MTTIMSEKFDFNTFHQNIQIKSKETFDTCKLFEDYKPIHITMTALKSLEERLTDSRNHLEAFTNENMYNLITLTRSTGAKQLQGAISNLASNIDRLSHIKDKFNEILYPKRVNQNSSNTQFWDNPIRLDLDTLRSPKILDSSDHEEILPQVASEKLVEIISGSKLAKKIERRKKRKSLLKNQQQDQIGISSSVEDFGNPRPPQPARSHSAPNLLYYFNTKIEIEDLSLRRSKSNHSEGDLTEWVHISPKTLM